MKLMGRKPNIGSYYQGEEKGCILNAMNALKWLRYSRFLTLIAFITEDWYEDDIMPQG